MIIKHIVILRENFIFSKNNFRKTKYLLLFLKRHHTLLYLIIAINISTLIISMCMTNRYVIDTDLLDYYTHVLNTIGVSSFNNEAFLATCPSSKSFAYSTYADHVKHHTAENSNNTPNSPKFAIGSVIGWFESATPSRAFVEQHRVLPTGYMNIKNVNHLIASRVKAL